MRLATKIHLSKFTLFLLMLITAIILVGTVVVIISAGFGLNPFRERTSYLLVGSFIGCIGLAVATLFLNIAANLSLIADTKLSQPQNDGPSTLNRWGIGVAIATIIAVAFIFIGQHLSEKKYLQVVKAQAEEVLNDHKDLTKKISLLLKSGSISDLNQIIKVLEFLSHQRRNLPQIILIHSGLFENKKALFTIPAWGQYEDKNFRHEYYECQKGIDCDYLSSIFSAGQLLPLEKFIRSEDQFYIYLPFEENDKRFVLRFSRHQRYGKVGS